MDSYDRRRLMEWTHRKAVSFDEHNHRAAPSSSSSSLSSRDSSSGSVGRKRKSTLDHGQRSCGNFHPCSLLLQKPRVLRDHHPTSLPRCRRSAPMLRNQRAFDNIAAPSNSTLNKRWDEFPALKIKKRCPCKAIYSDDRRAPVSLVKSPSGRRAKTKKIVKIADTSNLTQYGGPTTNEPNYASWYSSSDLNNFRDDARARAETTRRMMSYAATYDATYNSATGLTSPHALREYLSSPEDVVGIECLLAGQDAARSSLIRYHRKALLEGQFDVYDARRLAQRLGNDSRIAAHLARERAAYALRL